MKNDLIILLAKYLVFVIALIALTYWFRLKNADKKRLAASVIVAAVIAMVIAKIVAKLYYDPRPFVTQHLQPLVKHSADNGFPSEHTTLAMVITTSVYFFNRNIGRGLLALTILVGLGRIWARVHSPVDIAAGLLIGLAAGCLGYLAVQRFWPADSNTQS